MFRFAACAAVLGLSVTPASHGGAGRAATGGVEERTAPGSPMHYFISLPNGWSPTRQWPVVVVIPDAYREFERTAEEFATARGGGRFVIVVPMVLSSGGTAQKHMEDFDYAPSTWALARTVGNCAFDDEGLKAVVRDIAHRYHTDDRVFLAGWEAGGHVVIAQLLSHPERLRGVAMVTPNFIGRCVPDRLPPLAPGSRALPARIFHGALDPSWTPGNPLRREWGTLDRIARSHGFTNVRDSVIPAAGHGTLATDVLRYFGSLEHSR